METQPKLICKAEKTHLPTDFPVYYFGTPRAKVYAVYSILQGKTRIITAAKLEEFSFNYKEERLFEKNRPKLLPETAFNGNERMNIIQTSNFDSSRLTEIMAKSFLNESLSLKSPTDKLTSLKTSKSKE